MKSNKHLLVIASVWPEPKSSAAGRRLLQLISLFQANGWKITVASAAADSDYAFDLESIGIDRKKIQINDSEFDTFIARLDPAVVLFDRFITEEQFGWRVAEQCPYTLRILDTEDLHGLRKSRYEAIKSGQPFKEEALLQSPIAMREIAAIYRSDLSLIISAFEYDLLKDFFNIDEQLLHYLPFLLSPIDQHTQQQWPAFNERSHFVMIGNFQHQPNWDAVLFLKQKVWPLIRDNLPTAEVHIYGAYPSQKVRALHQPTIGFHIKGRADDAAAVVRNARVCLAPLRFGAGLKGKLVEAMQCGTPSVTTKIGAEGINGSFDWSGLIANSPKEIATAASELYTNPTRWKKAQANGTVTINNRFDKNLFADCFIDVIDDLNSKLDEHRNQNFIGSMLRHHSMASTKYMSRWIEAKNNGQ